MIIENLPPVTTLVMSLVSFSYPNEKISGTHDITIQMSRISCLNYCHSLSLMGIIYAYERHLMSYLSKLADLTREEKPVI